MTSKVLLREEIVQLRNKVKDLQLKINGLHLVAEALWEAQWSPNVTISISYGDPSQLERVVWPGYCKELAEEGHQISKVIDTELKRLKELFPDHEKCTQCGKWLDLTISCCPHCLAST